MSNSGTNSASTRCGVKGDIADMWRAAEHLGVREQLKALHKRSTSRALMALVGDWCQIVLAVLVVQVFGAWALPVAIVVVSSRQRALLDLIHDDSHASFLSLRGAARALAHCTLYAPMLTSEPRYRREHSAHHSNLGDPTKDPDFVHDPEALRRGWWCALYGLMCKPALLRSSIAGDVLRCSLREHAAMAAWWLSVALLCLLSGATSTFATFSLVWLLSKATGLHFISAFRELSDHSGLRPGGVISFTRTHTPGGLLVDLVFPHCNGLHLVHHLLPGVPSYRLRDAHALLLVWQPYRQAEHCNSLLSGATSAIKSWVKFVGVK